MDGGGGQTIEWGKHSIQMDGKIDRQGRSSSSIAASPPRGTQIRQTIPPLLPLVLPCCICCAPTFSGPSIHHLQQNYTGGGGAGGCALLSAAAASSCHILCFLR